MTAFRELMYEIAIDLHNAGFGQFNVSDPTARTIFVGEIPQDIVEGLTLINVPSPPPEQYFDHEYQIIDFWASSPHSDRAVARLRDIYNYYNRRYSYDTANWHIFWSRALGDINDADRGLENSKLYRLSVQFLCRNLTNVS